jgi:hypothetical protein
MRKVNFLLLFSSFCLVSFGQLTTVTPKAGVTLSKARNFIFEKEYFKPGFLFGVEADFNLSSKLVFKPELVFEQKGTLQKTEGVDLNGHPMGTIKMFYTWNYISIPLTLKYMPFAKNQIYFQGGGYAGYLLGETRRMQYSEAGVDHDEKESKDVSGYGKWDIGLLAGGGIDIPVGKRNAIRFDARCGFAFNLGGSEMPPATDTFGLSAGYAFGVAK